METLTKLTADRFFRKASDRLRPLSSAALGVIAGMEIWIPAFLIRQVFTAERIAQFPENSLTKPLEITYNFIDLIAYHPIETVLAMTTTGTLISTCKFLSRRRRS